MLIKCQYMKDGQPFGKSYTFESFHTVEVGDIVYIDQKTKGVVTDINIPESEVATFRDRIKRIVGKAMKQEE